MFDAWLHTECGLDNMTRAQYTDRELKRLQLGWALRQRESEEAARNSGPSPSMRQQRRAISRNHRSVSEQMFRDLKQN